MALIDFYDNENDQEIVTVNADKIVSIGPYSAKETLVSTVDPENYIITKEPRKEAVIRWDNALMGKREELK